MLGPIYWDDITCTYSYGYFCKKLAGCVSGYYYSSGNGYQLVGGTTNAVDMTLGAGGWSLKVPQLTNCPSGTCTGISGASCTGLNFETINSILFPFICIIDGCIYILQSYYFIKI